MTDALSRGKFRTPLVVGDRLDTDIAGANAAGLPSLLVLSGVSTAADTVRAAVGQRPNYIADDLRSLYARADSLRVGPHPAWRVDVGPSAVTVHIDRQGPGRLAVGGPGHRQRGLERPASTAGRLVIARATTSARQAMERWSLLSPPNRLA